MMTETKKQIRIDLDQFKLHLNIEKKKRLSLHFDSPSRKFYLSVIAFVVSEMKKSGGKASISLKKSYEVLELLNETVGKRAGASTQENLLPRIYKKWKSALPDLENAPLFRILGRSKEYGEGIEKAYKFSDEEKDSWANLFDYSGSGENVRLRFSTDGIGVSLDNIEITFGGESISKGTETWEKYIQHLKQDQGKKPGAYKPSGELASLQKMTFPLPDKPSIAVLPFENIGGDTEQEYLSNGIVESIITQLAQLPQLFVISRQSTFTYKGKNVKVKQVAEELGVRYILEGSVQSSGNRVRVTAQLIDAITGRHVWADRYERELKDIFAVQDEISQNVVAELGVQLGEGEQLRLAIKKSPNVEAYKYWWKGVDEFRKFTKESNQKSRELAEKALEIDPHYTLAYSLIAWTYYSEVAYGWSKNPAQSMEKIDQFINKALEVDPDSGDVPNLLTCVYGLKGEYDQAISQGRRAVERWPNICDSHAMLAWVLVKAGQPDEAIEEITKAMRLAPSYPTWFLLCLGQSYFLVGRYEEAIVALKKYLEREPQRIDNHAWLAAVYNAMGQEDQAQIEAKELLKKSPTFTLKQWRPTLALGFKDEVINDRIIHLASKAGLPE
jgi:TolB-like protein/Tfp pilus assembly protein PilF